MLLKNENASIRLDFVSYEFPETEYGMDEYDKNWRNCAAPGWMRMAIPIRTPTPACWLRSWRG